MLSNIDEMDLHAMMAEMHLSDRLSPNTSYFPIPSLYAGLAHENVEIVERILASDFVATTPEAEQAFAALPEGLRSESVVLIARAINFLYLGNFRAAHDLIEGANWSDDGLGLFAREKSLLLRSFLAFAKIVFKGSFELARTCLADLRVMFSQADLGNCTDRTVGFDEQE